MTGSWDRQPGESAKAYLAFCRYRDLGPTRCLDQASRAYHQQQQRGDADGVAVAVGGHAGRKSRASGIIRAWAERWQWRARAAAWDQELEHVKRREQVAAVQEMGERHAKESMLLQNKAVERLRQLHPEELKPRDVLSFLIEAAKLERLARGEPTERIAEEHSFPDVKELSDEELAAIVANGYDLRPGSGQGTATPADGTAEPL
jgi:hypothetical protein